MKKKALILLLIVCIFILFTGCNKETFIETIDGYNTYHKLSDGTWECKGITYKYRLEISGRMLNAVKDSTFVYLSNLEEITFDQAWKAAGLSSNSNDYFSSEDAILVELK